MATSRVKKGSQSARGGHPGGLGAKKPANRRAASKTISKASLAEELYKRAKEFSDRPDNRFLELADTLRKLFEADRVRFHQFLSVR